MATYPTTLANFTATGLSSPTSVAPIGTTRPRRTRPTGEGINGGNPMLRGGGRPQDAVRPALAPLPSGLPTPVLAPPAPPPTAPPAPAAPYTVANPGAQGLAHMGIPLPPTYTPRPPMQPLVNPYGGQQSAGYFAGSATPLRDQAQTAVNRGNGGMTVVSNPVTPGSAWNGGIGGPGQVAALNAWQGAQNNAQMLQTYGYRGEQMSNNDYAPGGAAYVAPPAAAAPMPANGQPVPAQGSIGAAGGGGGGVPAQSSLGAPAVSGGASYGGGVGGGNDTQFAALNQLAQAQDAQQIAAQNATEQRYADTLAGYGARFDRNMATLDGLGTAERADINRRMDSAQARNLQDSVSRGLAGTTILPGMRTLTERDRTQALGSLDERLRRERIGLDTQLSGDTLNVMQSRNDIPPDNNAAIALATALGQAGNDNLNQGGGYFGYGGLPDTSPLYVSNGLDGGAFGQPTGSYFGGGNGGGGNGNATALLMQMLMGGQQQQQPLSYVQRQQQQQMLGSLTGSLQNRPGGTYTRPLTNSPGGTSFGISGPGPMGVYGIPSTPNYRGDVNDLFGNYA